MSSSGRARRQKPLYKQASKVVCVRAFVNGDRDKYARVTAPNLKQVTILLQYYYRIVIILMNNKLLKHIKLPKCEQIMIIVI